jgi:hypothetical protein
MIKIISNNILYAQILEQTLSPFAQIMVLDQIENLHNNTELLIVVIDEYLNSTDYKKAIACTKEVASFAIIATNISNEDRNFFDMVFDMPVRLGFISKHVQSFYYKKLLMIKEKPIELAHYIFKPKESILYAKADNKTIHLTEKENHILYYLHQNLGAPITREELLKKIWGYSTSIETHTLETHIYRLRQKIEKTPTIPEIILTDEKGYFLKI